MGVNDGQEDAGLDPTVDFVAGTIAGMTSLVVGFPFDTVKVRFQSPAIAGKYRSTFHAITTIVREERFAGLYKGITSPLATAALMNGLIFASYRLLLKLQLPNGTTTPTIAQIALAGAGSGIVSSIVTTPTELIKIRQQACLTPTSATQMALRIFREGGLPSLYRGLTATALRDCGYGAYFAAYEVTCRYFSRAKDSSEPLSILSQVRSEMAQASWATMLLAGGVAGVVGWVATFPLDVVKTRVQGSHAVPVNVLSTSPIPAGVVVSIVSGSSTPLLVKEEIIVKDMNPYRTTLSTIVHSYRNEGVGVFFRGLAPTLIRAIPVNMVTFATFETVVHCLSYNN